MTIHEYLKTLPPSTVNNSRAIVLQAYEKAKHDKDGYWVDKLKELTGGITFDNVGTVANHISDNKDTNETRE